MNSPKRVTWRHCVAYVACLAAGIGVAAAWAVHAEAEKSVATVQEECCTACARFARTAETWMAARSADAAEGWISIDARQSFERAVDLMLLGTAAYVQVVVGDAVVADSVDPAWSSNVPLHVASAITEADSLMMYSFEGHLMCDTVVPIGATSGTSDGSASYARVGYELGALTSYLRTIRLAGAGIASAAFLVACAAAAAGLAWLDHRGTLLSPLNRFVQPLAFPQADRPLVLDERRKQVALNGKLLFLPPKPFQLLSLLVREQGRVLEEGEIVSTLWPEAELADSRDVRQCIYLLRKRLNAVVPGSGACIVNVKGFGYRYDADSLDELFIEAEPVALTE